jgi:small subunit ribosomal protein S18
MADDLNQGNQAPAEAPAAPAGDQPAPAPVNAPPAPAPVEGRRPYGPKRFQRRKVCLFCVDKIDYIDYKDMKRLRKFVTDRGKILPRRISGNCATHQRALTVALKRARNIALLPFKAE